MGTPLGTQEPPRRVLLCTARESPILEATTKKTGEDMAQEGSIRLPEDRMAYSPGEVRKFLGIGETLVYELLAQGKIRSIKAGRRTLIPAAALDEFLAG